MSEIVIAREAGACFGVERALSMVREAALAGEGPVYTFGPLIHNPIVVAELEQVGARVADDVEDVPEGATLVLRTHGVTPAVENAARAAGLQMIDATCPFVKRAHRAAMRLKEEGYEVLVVGEHGHPEAEGTCGHAEGARIVETPEEARAYVPARKVGLVVQTTMTHGALRSIVGELVGRAGELRLMDTICDATAEHQQACVELAQDVDVVVVVGGKSSANTTHLADIAREHCARVHHIEEPGELDPRWFDGAERIGITAGASTPQAHIEAVRTALEALMA